MDIRVQLSLAVLLFLVLAAWLFHKSPETPTLPSPWTTLGGHRTASRTMQTS